MLISVQKDDFSQDSLFKRLRSESGNNAGAVCTFTGIVRELDKANQSSLTALSLEHYPGMTEQALVKIAEQAKSRFSLSAIVIVHRVGLLKVGENIVYVGTAASHRKSAYDGCQFIMDYLKNDAPFWKKEFRADGSECWVEQKQSDQDAQTAWASNN